jgi:hypothetical protein
MISEWIIYLPVLIWLGILSWYDIKTREIPHSAWVIIPLILTGIYRVCMGGWQLVLLSMLVVAASERRWIALKFRWSGIARLSWWVPGLAVVFWMISTTSPVGALAITGFWIAWELKWWGGADSVVGIILMLVWPNLPYLYSMILSHFIGCCINRGIFTCKVNGRCLHTLAGIPLMLLSVVIFALLNMHIRY